MLDLSATELSRIQFGVTALYHFIFVPLTLGLSTICVIMESVYVKTNNEKWKEAVQFWGLLFGINFAMGVATGIPMEFQFGTNWQVYSEKIGDIFGAPLAIEGLMAFFLEATFIGLWFFGWQKLTKKQHLVVGWLMALGATFSAIWILIANGYMQYPTGAIFNVIFNRFEMVDFFALILNPIAQSKFAHTITAGYVTGAIFVISISAIYLLKGRNIGFAKRSIAVASSFGFIAIAANIWFGHSSADNVIATQPVKAAAMEGHCVQHIGADGKPVVSGLNVLGYIQDDIKLNGTCKFHGLSLPYVAGSISASAYPKGGVLPAIDDMRDVNMKRITNGLYAVVAARTIGANYLSALRDSKDADMVNSYEQEFEILKANYIKANEEYSFDELYIDPSLKAKVDEIRVQGLSNPLFITWAQTMDDFGYGLLLSPHIDDDYSRLISAEGDVNEAAMNEAAQKALMDSIPNVAPVFYSFHAMFLSGFFMLLFLLVTLFMSKKDILQNKLFLIWAIIMLPFPWIAAETGWVVAEYGRQPWAIQDLLPTSIAASDVAASSVWISLAMFTILYSALIIIELYLMIKFIKLGPDGLKNIEK